MSQDLDNRAKIRAALAAMMQRDSDAFVIIEEPSSGKFVQFAGSSGEPLLLDLPSQPLSPQDFARARELFRRLGVLDQQLDLPEMPAGRDFSFNAKCDSVDEAADIAMMVLGEVFGFPKDVRLALTEN